MRVRQPKLKRTSTRMREGIKKKAAAHQRKQRKVAKNSVQWTLRHRKDPGIPALFPYKDRILGEIEQGRLARAEAKVRRAEDGEDQDGESDEEMDASEEEADEGNRLSALLEAAQQQGEAYEQQVEVEAEETREFVGLDPSDVDHSRKAYDKIFKSVVEASDVVLYVLDARDPVTTRSKEVERSILANPSKRLLLILNKCDLVPAAVVDQWKNRLSGAFPTIPLTASSSGGKGVNKSMTTAVLASALLTSLKGYAAKSNLKRSVVVGVIGYPNVGKSSVINALTGRHGRAAVCPTGNIAGVTTLLREVKVDGKLTVLDSPGIVFPNEVTLHQLALISAIPPKAIKDPVKVVTELIKRLANDPAMADQFKLAYALPPIAAALADEFCKLALIHIARKAGRLGKGGVPNLVSAALVVLSDWRDGKISGWVTPDDEEIEVAPAAEAPKTATSSAELVTTWAKEFDLEGLL